jgi:serine/threonine-protein kinase
MEYLDGPNLERVIDDNGPLPVERALLIAAQITRALEAAHAADIIHRDLKPANVMLVNRKDEEDFVKVLDFGISKHLDDGESPHAALTRPNVAIGTPVYMAPEQAAGRPADPLTDVYAVGGLMYEMLTGQPPCAGEDAMVVLTKKANEDPPPARSLRPDLPPDVDRLVMRALARDPSGRHPSMAALKDAVLAALAVIEEAAAPVLTPPKPHAVVRAPTTTKTPRRALRPIHVAGAAGAALAVVVGVYLLTGPEARVAAPAPPAPSAVATAVTSEAVRPPAPAREPASPEPAVAAPPDTTAAPRAAMLPASTQAPVLGAPSAGALGTRSPESLGPPSAELLGAPAAEGLGAAAAPPHTPTAARREAPRARDVARPLETIAAPRPAPSAAPGPPPSPPAPVSGTAGDAILSRGQVDFDHGDYPGAVRRGREAIAAGATLGGRLLVGDAYYRLERYPDAMREYEAALAIDPTNPIARRRLELAREAAGRPR